MRVINNNIFVENNTIAREKNGIILTDVIDIGCKIGTIYAGDEKAMGDNGLAVGDVIYYPKNSGFPEIDYDGKDITVLNVFAVMGKFGENNDGKNRA